MRRYGSIASSLCLMAGLLDATATARAEQLVHQIDGTTFTVSIPELPKIPLAPHPRANMNPAAKLMGWNDQGLTVSILASRPSWGTPAQCASWLAGDTIARMKPDLATVRLFPVADNAWVLLYTQVLKGIDRLSAHVYAGDDKHQCFEVHVSQFPATPAQREDWLAGFRGVTVKAE